MSKKFHFVVTCIYFLLSAMVPVQAATEVTACDVTFNLPSHLLINRPSRSINGAGVRECMFVIVPVKTRRGECKDKSEGGSAPFKVCDWVIDFEQKNVVVAQTNLRHDKKRVADFYFGNHAWRISEGQEADEIDFFGKSAMHAESSSGAYWYRKKIQNSPSIFAGSGGVEHILFQLTPTIAVALQSPPEDDESSSECTIFCSSLRAAKRK
jgi:hypothetical protein